MIAGGRTRLGDPLAASVPSVASTVRSSGIVPSEITATGVVGERPWPTSSAAIAAAFSTAIISTRVPPRPATALQPTSESGWPGARWPDTTVKSWATPRWVTGMPAVAGTPIGLGSPGTTRDRHAGLAARQHLLEAAAEHEGVAALEPHHPLAGAGAVDEHRVDLLLRRRTAARQLGHVDELDVGAELVEQRARRQPVGHDDVGRGQRVARRHRDQLGVARPTADQHDARRVVERAAVVSRPSRSASTMSSRSAADWRGSRLPSTATVTLPWRPDAVVHAEASRASSARTQKTRRSSAAGQHPRVDLGVVGGRDDVPGVVEVGLLERGAAPA